MRTFATYSFYLFGVVVLFYEMLKLGGFNPHSILKDATDKAKLEQDKNKELEATLEEPSFSDQIALVLTAFALIIWTLVYFSWSIIGLFTSQWEIFLALFILSLATGAVAKIFKNHISIILKVDAFITVILLVFMLINRFHLHWI